MKFNLAEYNPVTVNTTVGNKPLTSGQLLSVLSSIDTPIFNLYGDDILCLDVDLGARVEIDEVRYYFTASGTQASGIEFYYMNDENDGTYVSIPTNTGVNYFYSTVSGASAPRYVRLVHTISGTSISGSVYGFEVLNNDDEVDFGTDGSKVQEYFNVAQGHEDIRTVPIYNDGTATATAYVQIEADNSDLDEIIYLGTSPTGPWKSVLDEDDVIHEVGDWDGVTHLTNSLEYNGVLSISSDTNEIYNEYIPGYVEDYAQFTTKLFPASNTRFSSIYIKDGNYEYGSRISVDDSDNVRSFEVRTASKPLDYTVVRRLYSYTIPYYYKVGFRDYWTFDNSTIIYYVENILNYYYTKGSMQEYYLYYDVENKYTVGMAKSSGSQYELFLMDNDDSSTFIDSYTILQVSTTVYGVTTNCYFYKMRVTNNGGIWFYIYVQTGNSGYYLDTGGYYLCYFDSSLNSVFKLYNASHFSNDFDIVKSAGYIWYTDFISSRVNKLSSDGTTVVNFVSNDTTDVYAICTTSDGGCWFSNNNDLIRLDANGNQVNALRGVGETGEIHELVCDGDDALWYREANYVSRILLTSGNVGRSTGSTYVQQASDILLTQEGLWVHALGYWYLVENDGTLTKSVGEESNTYRQLSAIISATVDTEGYENRFPVSYDVAWQGLAYTSVYTDKYHFPDGNEYCQLRITMRDNNPCGQYSADPAEVWSDIDGFDYGTDGKPSEHRWSCTDGVIVEGGKCKFVGNGDEISPDERYITSYDKWFFKHPDYVADGVDTVWDYQIDYEIPSTNLSSEVKMELLFVPYPVDNAPGGLIYDEYNSYHKVILYRRPTEVVLEGYTSGLQYSGILYTKSTSLTLTTLSGVVGAGTIRYRVEGHHFNVFHMDSTESSWQSSGLMYFGFLNFYYQPNLWFKAKVTNPYDIYFDNFKFNDYGNYPTQTTDTKGTYFYKKVPEIQGIYKRNPIAVTVPPNDSADVYLRTYVPNSMSFAPGTNYDTNLKVWWEKLI